MSKELEEIKSLVFIHFGALGFYNPSMNDEIIRDRDKVLKYLDSLEAIDNAKPSKAWRELNIIRHLEIGFDKNGKPITLNDIDGLNTIKQALLKAQEQEKENAEYKRVLEIIKNKKVLIVCLLDANTLEDYNCQVMSWNKLLQEEFDLLKRYFG